MSHLNNYSFSYRLLQKTTNKLQSQTIMSEYFYSSAKKNTFSEEPTYLPTAQKSQFRIQSQGFFERTPEKFPIFSSAKKEGRLSDAKRSIEECIQMVSEKKRMNEEALGEVKQVNHEILGSLSWLNPAKTSLYEPRNKTTEQYRRDDFKQNAAVSQFEWKPFASPQRINLEDVRSNPSQSTQQNVELRSKLNTEIKKNNDLIKHVSNLEAQVASLRSSKYQVNQSGNFNDILEENRYLRNQLANSQLVGNNYSLIEELERLKAQNSQLRRDTITLLKSRPY